MGYTTRATLDPNIDVFFCHICDTLVNEVEIIEGTVTSLFGGDITFADTADNSYILHPCSHRADKMEYTQINHSSSSQQRRWKSSGFESSQSFAAFSEPIIPALPDYEHCPTCNIASVGLCIGCR